jgi:hypothetical protein
VSQSDPGAEVLDQVRVALSIDDEWTAPVEGGFVWWAFRLAQGFTATPPVQVGERMVSTVHISTPVVSGVEDDPSEALAIANQQAVLNALVWDEAHATIVESCTAQVTNDNAEWVGRGLATAAVIQNAAAHSRAPGLAEATGGRPAAAASLGRPWFQGPP